MCLAVPLRITEIRDKEATGEFDGVLRRIRLDFVPNAQVGDYVMVHAGFAIETIREEQAQQDREAYREVLRAQ